MISFNPFKGIKKVVSKVGKAFKSIGKKIKKVGSKIWSGVKGAIGKVSGLLNKMGPLGMIAMSFILPGLGNMLGPMWTSMATNLSAQGMGAFANAIGNGMTWVGNAVTTAKGFISKGFTSITDKITGSLNHVAGSISEGAKNMWSSAKQFMGIQDPLEAGKLIGQSAQKGFTDAAIQANPELLRMAGGDVIKAGEIARSQGEFLDAGQRLFTGNTPSTVFRPSDNPELLRITGGDPTQAATLARQQEVFLQANKATALDTNPEFLRMAGGDVNKARELAKMQTADLGRSTAALQGKKNALTAPIVSATAKGNTLDKVIGALTETFGGEARAEPLALPFFASQPDAAELTATRRGGIGGRGSAGGQFLSKSILNLIQEQNKRIEALG